MTTTAPHLPPITRQHLVDACEALNHGPDVHAALLDELQAQTSPAGVQLYAALYALRLRPGQADLFDQLVDRVAIASADVARGYRVDHNGLCSHAVGCDTCDQHWTDLLDDAVRDLEYALGDRAVTDLLAVAA